jgi:hypothetical protein
MKMTRFEAIPSIQQTVTRDLKAIWEQAFSAAFDLLFERAGTTLSDDINKYFYVLSGSL